MNDSAAIKKLWDLVRVEGLDEPSWVLSLKEADEPPLFSRDSQIAFLARVPQERRGPLVLRVGTQVLDRIADCVAANPLPAQQRMFCAVTFTDFDYWRRGERPIPTPAIYVSPHEELEPGPGQAFVRASSPDGREVARWMLEAGPSLAQRFCVVELGAQVDADLRRVYVSWRTGASGPLESLGKELW